MGNGCACADTGIMIEKIKIRRNRYNTNKKFLDINLQFCKENNIGPFFVNETKDNYKNTLFLLKKIGYSDTHKITKVNYLDLNYQDIYSYNTIAKLKEGVIDKLDTMRINSLTSLNSTIFRSCLYYLMLEKQEVTVSPDKLVLKDNETTENVDSTILYQIQCDIPRTFPLMKILKEQVFIDNLTDVLVTISVRDKDLSYVQGLNFVVAFLLLITGNDKCRTLEFFFSIMYLRSKTYNKLFKGKDYILTKRY
jgi:hypothetical protein